MIGYFGGKTVDLLTDYKKPSTNPFFEYKKCLAHEMFDETMLVPLLKWFSNSTKNIRQMQKINEQFFFVDKTILSHQLFLSINRSVRFIKYPKKDMVEHEFGFLVPYIQRLYGWSDREYSFYADLIDLGDTELHQELHRMFGFDSKECRKLGISFKKIKAKYSGKTKEVGYF